MYRLYDYLPSGNGYKVRLLLTQLGQAYEWIELDILSGETRTADFLAKNPNGRIPVLEVSPGEFLSESNAILMHLGEDTQFLPQARLARSRVLEWLFFEQYSHEPYIATSRFWRMHGMVEQHREALAQKQAPGYAALGVLETRLAEQPFLVGDRYTIADMALFAYTHVAPEGGFDLTDFPRIQAWIARVQAQPHHISIIQSPLS
jgi:glutathione S-transferase